MMSKLKHSAMLWPLTSYQVFGAMPNGFYQRQHSPDETLQGSDRSCVVFSFIVRDSFPGYAWIRFSHENQSIFRATTKIIKVDIDALRELGL